MNFKINYYIIFFCFVVLTKAQHTVCGRAVDIEGKPITELRVYDKIYNSIHNIDGEGFFKIKYDKSKKHSSIVFISDNYGLIEKDTVSDSDIDYGNIVFSKIVKLSEIELWKRRTYSFDMRRLKDVEGTTVYASKKTEVIVLNDSRSNISSGTQRQIFSKIVGLNIYENNQASVQLHIGGRGLNPNRTSNFSTRQNGYDISADVLGYPESYYTPPTEALKEIRFIRGAASLQYGTQFGGLIDFLIKDPPVDKKIQLYTKQIAGSFGLFNSFNSLGGTVGKFKYYTFINYKCGRGFRPNSNFSANNIFGRFIYDISPKTRFSFDVTVFNYLSKQPGGITDAQFYENMFYSNRTRNRFLVRWNLFNFGSTHKFSEKTTLTANIFGLNATRKSVGFFGNQSVGNYNPVTDPDEMSGDEFAYPRDVVVGIFRNWGAETKLVHRYDIKGKNTVLLLGGKYYQSQNTSLQGAGSEYSNADFRIYDDRFKSYPNQSYFKFPNFNLAFFGEHIFYLNDKLSIVPGFRYDYILTRSKGQYQSVVYDLAGNAISNITSNDNRTFPRRIFLFGVGVGYKPFSNVKLYGNISKNYRSVTFSDIHTVSPTFIIDPGITDESGYTLDVGLKGNGSVWSYDANVFGIFYNHRIGLILDDRAYRLRTNVGNAIIYGFESLVNLDLAKLAKLTDTHLDFFNNLAITKSRYIKSQINGIEGNDLEFVPLVNLKLGIDMGYGNFTSSVQYSFLSQQFTEATNAYQDKHDDNKGTIGLIPSYGVLDISFGYKLSRFKIEGGANNVIDNHYFTQRALSYPGPGIIPAPPRNFYVGLSAVF